MRRLTTNQHQYTERTHAQSAQAILNKFYLWRDYTTRMVDDQVKHYRTIQSAVFAMRCVSPYSFRMWGVVDLF